LRRCSVTPSGGWRSWDDCAEVGRETPDGACHQARPGKQASSHPRATWSCFTGPVLSYCPGWPLPNFRRDLAWFAAARKEMKHQSRNLAWNQRHPFLRAAFHPQRWTNRGRGLRRPTKMRHQSRNVVWNQRHPFLPSASHPQGPTRRARAAQCRGKGPERTRNVP